MTLPDLLGASREELETARAGRLSAYVDAAREGRPLVLVHSVNAAPSAYEMMPLFEHYRATRPVFALELPGFGHSERGDRPYTTALYVDALNAFLEARVAGPADVVALSLSAEFAAAAALARPEGFASLVLVSPTGLGGRLAGPGARRVIRGLTGAPLVSDALFELLTSRPSIRYYLGQSFHGDPPEAMIEAAHRTAHQPGAKYAPFAFLSFELFTPDARTRLYEPLELPVLALYDEDPHVSFEALPGLVRSRPNWHAERIAPTRGLPHWEKPDETVAAIERFWSDPS